MKINFLEISFRVGKIDEVLKSKIGQLRHFLLIVKDIDFFTNMMILVEKRYFSYFKVEQKVI